MPSRILKEDSEKRALIRRLSGEGRILMFFYEEDPGDAVAHQKVSESITVVHPPYDYETLEKWLHLGNWQAIFPCNKDYRPFNTFKARSSDIARRMKEAKVELLIDSFHDDIEWNVYE